MKNDRRFLVSVAAAGLLIAFALICTASGQGIQLVTCGSVIKLLNANYKVRLHSHAVQYGSGSGQQSVTGTDLKEDVNSHWYVKGPNKTEICQRGEPIECQQEIRLQHVTTGKYLHSHLFKSPLSDQQEVSAFGDGGEGDTGDVWKVICGSGSGESAYWARDDSAVNFKHIDTEAYLGVSGRTFGRPINGQMEVVGVPIPDITTRWKTAEGIFVHPSNFNPKKEVSSHDEL